MTNKLNIIDENEMHVTDKHVFFFGSVFSNFFPVKFTYAAFNEMHEFFCTEQAFMWHKAMLFKDQYIAQKILDEKSEPYTCKKLGRSVKGYNDTVWAAVRYNVMYMVNMAKFTQNTELKEFICDPRFDDKTFVEASPYDNIWGIKTAIGTSTIDDESTWKGQNLLGKCITTVRHDIVGHK